MDSSVGDFVAGYFFVGIAVIAFFLIALSAYFRPTPLRIFCLVNNVMTIAQASCTLAFCYGMSNVKSIAILFFTCRLGYVTLTAYELLKIGNRIQKNRSSVTRATLFWALSPVVVYITFEPCELRFANILTVLTLAPKIGVVCYS